MIVLTDWLLTPEGVAVHVPTNTGVLADLHLGYNEARSRRGEAVPLMGVAPLLAPLAALLARSALRRLVIAGDLFEDAGAATLFNEMLLWLKTHDVELLGVVPGNHDRGLEAHAKASLICPDGIDVGGWRVLHGDKSLPPGRVIHGHVHPCLRHGDTVSAPCYLVSKDRMVLPAFSADARGVNVMRAPRWRAFQCCVCAKSEVLDFGQVGAMRETLEARTKPTVSRTRKRQ